MRRACVIGWPISHSRSPLIHGYWLKRYEIEGAYTKEAVEPERAAAFLEGLASAGFVGCNVTVPHKETAFAVAAERMPAAEAIGAANTVWLEGGRLVADNTDGYGFMENLRRSAPEWRSERGALVLGAGGSARAVVHALIEAGVPGVIICNRSPERADAIAAAYPGRAGITFWSQRQGAVRASGLVVNTTTLGMKGEGSPDIDFTGCAPGTVVYDLVYVPLETPFLAAARKAGLRTVDGLGMLLHQAVPGFERWFGVRPEVTDELRALVVADIEGSSARGQA
jgi:shikimate dehydrogenase